MILKIIFYIILLFLAITGIQKIIFSFSRKKLLKAIERHFGRKKLILQTLNADFLGKDSAGGGRIRGHGALVLSLDELWFCLAASAKEISIPISTIKSVELKRSHLKRIIFRKLLALNFYYQGRDETIAWYVPNPDEWRVAIESLMKIR